MRVDVYPTKDGQPVNDLTRDDFEVVEDKTPQRIEQFEQVQIRAASTPTTSTSTVPTASAGRSSTP